MVRMQLAAKKFVNQGFISSESKSRTRALQIFRSSFLNKFCTLVQSQPQEINMLEKDKVKLKVTSNFGNNNSNNKDFSLEVAKKALNNSKVNKNMVCSPFSIDTSLNALVVDAKGKTLEQLLDLLGYNNMDEVVTSMASRSASIASSNTTINGDGPIISYANGVWLDKRYTLNASYKEFLQNIYKPQPKVVDFLAEPYEVVKDVNSWVEKQTNGLIPKLLSSHHTFGPYMAMLLANALYFKGTWGNTFDSTMTQYREFHRLNGDTVRVPFMKNSNCWYEHGSYEGCKVLKMPYKNGKNDKRRFSMYIFLPEDTHGLPKLMENIKLHNNMFDNDQINLTKVKFNQVLLPKFEFESTIKVSDTMKEIGLILPFDYPNELTNIVEELGDGFVYVSDIVQKCRIETNETGTKAACCTRSYYGCACAPPMKFIVDHPFMFMIREDHFGAILFMGTVYDPQR